MEEKKIEIPYDELISIYRDNRIRYMVHEKRRDNISSKRPRSRSGLVRNFLRMYSGMEKWENRSYEDEVVEKARERLKIVSKRTLDKMKKENTLHMFVEGMIVDIEDKIE